MYTSITNKCKTSVGPRQNQLRFDNYSKRTPLPILYIKAGEWLTVLPSDLRNILRYGLLSYKLIFRKEKSP